MRTFNMCLGIFEDTLVDLEKEYESCLMDANLGKDNEQVTNWQKRLRQLADELEARKRD